MKGLNQYELEFYLPEQVSVSNGNLVIKTDINANNTPVLQV